jgi:predicted deacylase
MRWMPCDLLVQFFEDARMTLHLFCRQFRPMILFALVVLAGCASTTDQVQRYCESAELLVHSAFEGGNFQSCAIRGGHDVSIEIHPEDEPPINPSAWYAFQLNPKQPVNVQVSLNFSAGYARYWPKISTDGKNWTPMAKDVIRFAADGQSLSLRVRIEQTPVWISAQELLLPSFYHDWIRKLSIRPDVVTRTLGRSVQGRPIYAASTRPRPDAIILIGRQHPPEVSGAFAMKSFVNTVMADTKLANEFRNQYSVIIIPLLNPDGVALGHWRHNVNGVDLNRDWGEFTQPETQSVERLLSELERSNVSLQLMLDFHSTRSSLFYTQLAKNSHQTADFATTWLSRARKRLPGFEFKHDPRPPSGQANTKNYFHIRYGIPAITYELGDEVDRDDIADSAPVFAEEMMRLMLERPAKNSGADPDSS